MIPSRAAPPPPSPEEVEAFERHLPPFARNRRVRDVPELAWVRYHFRKRYYWLADFFFGASLFQIIVWSWTGSAFAELGFMVAFPLLLFCEFQARAMTRQLARRAAEQMLRDLAGRVD